MNIPLIWWILGGLLYYCLAGFLALYLYKREGTFFYDAFKWQVFLVGFAVIPIVIVSSILKCLAVKTGLLKAHEFDDETAFSFSIVSILYFSIYLTTAFLGPMNSSNEIERKICTCGPTVQGSQEVRK